MFSFKAIFIQILSTKTAKCANNRYKCTKIVCKLHLILICTGANVRFICVPYIIAYICPWRIFVSLHRESVPGINVHLYWSYLWRAIII